jgi:hypothetical protein
MSVAHVERPDIPARSAPDPLRAVGRVHFSERLIATLGALNAAAGFAAEPRIHVPVNLPLPRGFARGPDIEVVSATEHNAVVFESQFQDTSSSGEHTSGAIR